jgi:DEAD/DEAH box helicase domain-containing protein
MYWSGPDRPAARVGLRSGSGTEYELVDEESERAVGTVDDARVFTAAHPGALYLHQGRQYRVDRLDQVNHVAWLEACDRDEYTQPRVDIDIAIAAIDERATAGPGAVHLGAVEVTNLVHAYQRLQISTRRLIEVCDLDLPPRTLTTRACWWTVPLDALLDAGLEPAQVLGTVHAAEHGLIGLLPLFTICDRWDVGGVSMAAHPQTGEPTIFVYDGYAGGAGIAELAFADAGRLVDATLDLVAACPCDDGCPSCVQSPKCGNGNDPLDKAGAGRVLRLVLSALAKGTRTYG